MELRFADFLLDELVTCLADIRLQLNVRQIKLVTIQSKNPSEVLLRNGQAIEVFDRGSTHKWLVRVHVMHGEYGQSSFTFGTSPPCCKQALLGKEECGIARPFQAF